MRRRVLGDGRNIYVAGGDVTVADDLNDRVADEAMIDQLAFAAKDPGVALLLRQERREVPRL